MLIKLSIIFLFITINLGQQTKICGIVTPTKASDCNSDLSVKNTTCCYTVIGGVSSCYSIINDLLGKYSRELAPYVIPKQLNKNITFIECGSDAPFRNNINTCAINLNRPPVNPSDYYAENSLSNNSTCCYILYSLAGKSSYSCNLYSADILNINAPEMAATLAKSNAQNAELGIPFVVEDLKCYSNILKSSLILILFVIANVI